MIDIGVRAGQEMIMRPFTMRTVAAACLVVALPGAAMAFGGGGGNSGSGLSPYAAETGNDRSAGVNNGNYRDPRLDPYLGAYGGRYDRPVEYRHRPAPRPYYGYPY